MGLNNQELKENTKKGKEDTKGKNERTGKH